ncbi:MAG: prepilin-type N-terminal cleavage/methylation domain-containing protein [Bdellovibrionota bacterium]
MIFEHKHHRKGFSLIEVLAAFVILSISIIVFMENQSLALRMVSRIDNQNQAIVLAQMKMAQTNLVIDKSGIQSIKDEEAGAFEGDESEGYEWKVLKRNVPAPDFISLMSSFSGETDDAQDQQLNQASQGPMKAITDIWGKALREIEIQVLWKEDDLPKSISLFSHYVDESALGQVDGLINALGQQLQGLGSDGGGEQ